MAICGDDGLGDPVSRVLAAVIDEDDLDRPVLQLWIVADGPMEHFHGLFFVVDHLSGRNARENLSLYPRLLAAGDIL